MSSSSRLRHVARSPTACRRQSLRTVIEFITTALVQQPRRVGKPLSGDLVGIWAARRGTYRLLYRVREQPREVVVLRIEHRRDAYRSH